MSDGSKIEWTEATWNPLRGCTRVSPGCGGPGPHGGCYAEAIAARFSDPGQPYHGLATRTSKGGRWTGKVMLVEHMLDQPLRWRRPRMIFVNSMSDLFHESVPDEWIDRVFAVMALCPQHTFQVLTKRSARMRAYLSSPVRASLILDGTFRRGNPLGTNEPDLRAALACWPLRNVWLGVSVEDQQRADERVPDLLATPAAVRWLSCEPLLGPVNLRGPIYTYGRGGEGPAVWFPTQGGMSNDYLGPDEAGGAMFGDVTECPKLDWIVAGGESGPGARPMHPDWARSLRDQCAAAGVPFFFKQWGEWEPTIFAAATHFLDEGGRLYERNDPASVGWALRKTGKKRAGRLLDGVLHDAMPERAA